jgi:glycine oxidase
MDAIVVGGGLIGCAIAAELQRRGRAVMIAHAGHLGAATTAAAGILGAQCEAEAAGPVLRALVEGRALWPRFLDDHGLSRDEIELRSDGAVELAHDAAEETALAARAVWQESAGLRVERLDGAALARLEPALAPARAGLWLRDDGAVDPSAVLRLLISSAAARGVRFVQGEVTRVAPGVVEVAGVSHRAAAVIVAAGSWSSELAGLSVTPVRGQVVALDAPSVSRVVIGGGAYLVPRRGTTFVGSTMERVGFEVAVMPAVIDELSARAVRLCPKLASAKRKDAWAGFRPITDDGLPLVGPRKDGVIVAFGHGRNGILLAPITAHAVAGILDGNPVAAAAPWLPSRLGA